MIFLFNKVKIIKIVYIKIAHYQGLLNIKVNTLNQLIHLSMYLHLNILLIN
jgi:hypothetical protein